MIAALPSVLYSRGVRVPDDLSVAGMFSEDFGRLFSLPYTAVETSPSKLGRLEVQALVQWMTGRRRRARAGWSSSRPSSRTGGEHPLTGHVAGQAAGAAADGPAVSSDLCPTTK